MPRIKFVLLTLCLISYFALTNDSVSLGVDVKAPKSGTVLATSNDGRAVLDIGSDDGVQAGDHVLLSATDGTQHFLKVIRTTPGKCAADGAVATVGNRVVSIPWSRSRLVGKQLVLDRKKVMIVDAMIIPTQGIQSITVIDPQILETWDTKRWTRVRHACNTCKMGMRQKIERFDRYESRNESTKCEVCNNTGWLTGEEAAIQSLVSNYKTYSAKQLGSLTIGQNKFYFDPINRVLTDFKSSQTGLRLLAERRAKSAQVTQARERKRQQEALEQQNRRQARVAEQRVRNDKQLRNALIGIGVATVAVVGFAKLMENMGDGGSGYSGSPASGAAKKSVQLRIYNKDGSAYKPVFPETIYVYSSMISGNGTSDRYDYRNAMNILIPENARKMYIRVGSGGGFPKEYRVSNGVINITRN